MGWPRYADAWLKIHRIEPTLPALPSFTAEAHAARVCPLPLSLFLWGLGTGEILAPQRHQPRRPADGKADVPWHDCARRRGSSGGSTVQRTTRMSHQTEGSAW